MSFVDNLRDVLNNIGINNNAGTSGEKYVEPKHLDIMEERKSNQYPSGWVKQTYDIVTPEYDDEGNEVGYGMGMNDILTFYYDENGELAGAETPMQSYDLSNMSKDDAIVLQGNLIRDYSRGGRFGTLLMNEKKVRNKGERHYRS